MVHESDVANQRTQLIEEGFATLTGSHVPAASTTTSVDLDQPESPHGTTEIPSFIVSGYMLLNIIFLFVFGTAKLVMTLHVYSALPTVLDYITGVIFVIMSVYSVLKLIHLFTDAADI